jgi:hypothetical protein
MQHFMLEAELYAKKKEAVGIVTVGNAQGVYVM